MASELQTAETPQTHRKPVKRLTDIDRAFALRYQAEGLTQVEIAKRLGCDQGTVSRWLSQCTDTSTEAGTYFRGQALTLAQKIVKDGRPSDHVKVLEGIEVLKQQQVTPIVNVLVGMPGQAVPVPSLPTFDATFSVEPDNQALSPVVTRELAE
jgi:predicted transcriptional regulator